MYVRHINNMYVQMSIPRQNAKTISKGGGTDHTQVEISTTRKFINFTLLSRQNHKQGEALGTCTHVLALKPLVEMQNTTTFLKTGIPENNRKILNKHDMCGNHGALFLVDILTFKNHAAVFL